MIKRCIGCVAAAVSLVPSGAFAQSGAVTIYGIIDSGLTYVDNQAGHHDFKLADGANYGNRLGFKGEEDLGGGTKAIFTLEQGFNLNKGTLGQSGRAWGRQAFMGLTDINYGTLTFGRQYDFIREYYQQFNLGGFASVYAGHQGDYDRVSGKQLDNTIKYMTPNFSGFTAGGMWAFGEQPGQFQKKAAWSLGAGYKHEGLNIGAAYVRLNDAAVYPYAQTGVYRFLGVPAATKDPVTGAVTDLYSPANGGFVTDKYEVAGIGASYKFGKLIAALNTSATRFTKGDLKGTQHVYELGGLYFLDGPWALVGGYQYAEMDGDKWNQFTGAVRFNFSKRTLIYTSASYLKASSGVDASQGAGFYLNPADTNHQTTVRMALVHFW